MLRNFVKHALNVKKIWNKAFILCNLEQFYKNSTSSTVNDIWHYKYSKNCDQKRLMNSLRLKRLEGIALKLKHPVSGWRMYTPRLEYDMYDVRGAIVRNAGAIESVAGPVTAAQRTYVD